MSARLPMPEIGARFGNWTVIDNKREALGNGQSHGCLCKCDCGYEGLVNVQNLRRGLSKSCGCHGSHNGIRTLPHRTANGESGTRLYHIWLSMLQRCNDPSIKEYRLYGARGILVCEEWSTDFLLFKTWALDNGYTEDLTIDRIDVNGNYEPGNCRWATWIEQQNNRRSNKFLTFNGKTQTTTMWSRETGIKRTTIDERLVRGWDIERALTEPTHNGGHHVS